MNKQGQPCTPSDIPRIPAFQSHCPWLPEGFAGPKWPLSPLDGSPCYHSGTKGFYKWCSQEGQRRRGMVGPQQICLPPPLRAAPQGTARQGRSSAKQCTSQPPPGAHCLPVRRGQESRTGLPTACHHTGQLSVRRGQSPLWELGAACQGMASCHSERPRGESKRPPRAIPVTADFASQIPFTLF